MAAAGGVAFDLGLRGGVANAMVVAGIALVVVGLATDHRIANRNARGLALAALAPAAGLVLRASPWLVAANLVAVSGLLSGAVAYSRSGSLTDTTLARLLRRLLATLPLAWSAPRLLAPLVPQPSERHADRARAVGRALCLAVPVLAVVVALLASADAVFAGLLTPDLHLGPITGHVVLAGAAALAVLAAIGTAAGDRVDPTPGGRFGAVEVTTMLGLAVAVLGLFSLAQLVALTGTGDRLVASSGLTPAEYARSGFFQLCWATAILLGYLGGVRALAAPGVTTRLAVRVLGALVPLLGLGLVAVSLRRMALYDRAFGLTMLRLSVVGAAIWFGIVLGMVGLRNFGIGRGREWVFAAAAGAALTIVLVADAANPEAFVVRHNLARSDVAVELDTSYLRTLSDDAVPAIAAAAADADPLLRRQLLDAVRCGKDATGSAALNVSARRATDARRRQCEQAANAGRPSR